MRLDRLMGTGDNQNIVVDEVLGMGITLLFWREGWLAMAIGFGLFRLFDSWKPWPIRWVDDWSKVAAKNPKTPWAGGFGVMADDLAAGIVALAILEIGQRFI